MKQHWSLVPLLSVLLAGPACSEVRSGPTRTASPPTSGASAAPAPTAASSPSATSSAASTATTAAAPASAEIHITAEQGQAAKLPPIGFSLRGVWSGFTRSVTPRAGTYLSLGGPPGGTLMFVVKAYQGVDPIGPTIEQLFTAWAGTRSASQPLVAGKPTSVHLAGADRPAQAFRIGTSHATTNWCVSLVPSRTDPRTGLWVMIGVSSRETAEPDCRLSTKHERLRPLVQSLRLDES